MATAQPPLTPPVAPAHPFLQALRSAGVIWAGMVALGFGLGVLVVAHGLPWWLAPGISALVFAGSVEFILVGMLAAGASVAAVAVTTALVNSRHLFYGLSFPLHVHRSRLAKAYSMFALTDEAFALGTAIPPAQLSGARLLWTQIGLHAGWVAGSLAGALIGRTVLGDVRGVDFILTALFLVLAMDAYSDRPDRATLALAVGAGVGALIVAHGSMILAAMSVFTAVLVARHVAATSMPERTRG